MDRVKLWLAFSIVALQLLQKAQSLSPTHSHLPRQPGLSGEATRVESRAKKNLIAGRDGKIVPETRLLFVENFDGDVFGRWIVSTSDQFAGEWSVAKRTRGSQLCNGGLSLMKNNAHHAVATHLNASREEFLNNYGKTLAFNYEVRLENPLMCKRIDVKLFTSASIPGTLSVRDKFEQFGSETPYVVLLGIEGCASNRLRFIVRQQNLKSGKWIEHELIQPPGWRSEGKRLSAGFAIHPNNTYAIYVNGREARSGTMLQDFEPPFTAQSLILESQDVLPGNCGSLEGAAFLNASKSQNVKPRAEEPQAGKSQNVKPQAEDIPTSQNNSTERDAQRVEFSNPHNISAFDSLGVEIYIAESGALLDNIVIGRSWHQIEQFLSQASLQIGNSTENESLRVTRARQIIREQRSSNKKQKRVSVKDFLIQCNAFLGRSYSILLVTPGTYLVFLVLKRLWSTGSIPTRPKGSAESTALGPASNENNLPKEKKQALNSSIEALVSEETRSNTKPLASKRRRPKKD